MKKSVLICDRCLPEEHPAAHRVWIRTAGMGRPLQADVCADAYALIIGSLSNGGARPTPAPVEHPRLKGAAFKPGSFAAKLATRVHAELAKHAMLTNDRLLALCYNGKPPKDAHQLHRVLTTLTRRGEVERYKIGGVFKLPGTAGPTPPRDEVALTRAVLRLVTAEPGIRSAYVGPLLGFERTSDLKGLLGELRRGGVLRSKGTKSATRYYPGTKQATK
jgi:hypothetical protein